MQVRQRLRSALGVFGAVVALTGAISVAAMEFSKAGVIIDHPHAMATAPGQPHGAVFFKVITNKTAQPEQLIGGRSAVSKSVEVHRMEMDNNIMRMREIPGIELPANAKVMMGRGSKEGYHLMLMNLKTPLKDGEKFPMTLIFKNAGEVEVMVSIEKPSSPMHGGHKH